jgi:hypothetical protein
MEFSESLKPDPKKLKIWKEKYSKEYFRYEEYIRSFTDKIDDQILRKNGVKSLKFINEIFSIDPITPQLLVNKIDGSQEKILGKKI